jgi:cysteinyl-tRNA synthetase
MPLRVYNTLTKQKEPFETVQPGKVGIYLCGPTVYKESHIGHMVGPVIFDTIKRYLTYCGYQVTLVVNITDVDDKLIAQQHERGVPMSQIAEEMTIDYLNNLRALGVDQIDQMPKATEHMGGIIEFTRALIDKGYAYVSGGDVLFDVTKDPGYGKLSNRRPEDQQGEGGEASSKKRNPGDFALWKSAKPGEPAWDSPWGKGRPDWHIECSAMSRALLGETSSFRTTRMSWLKANAATGSRWSSTGCTTACCAKAKPAARSAAGPIATNQLQAAEK